MATQPDFGKELERLEAIVRQLETPDLDLDQALKLFEEGVERLRAARDRLNAAQAKVKQVISDHAGTLKVDDLDGGDGPAGPRCLPDRLPATGGRGAGRLE